MPVSVTLAIPDMLVFLFWATLYTVVGVIGLVLIVGVVEDIISGKQSLSGSDYLLMFSGGVIFLAVGVEGFLRMGAAIG